MTGVRRNVTRFAPGVVLAVAAILVPTWFADDYQLQVLTMAGILAVAAIGYNIVLGEVGMLSLAHGPIFGSAAYGYAISADHLPTWLSALVGIAVAVLIAAAIGALTLARRLNHAYFAIATFALGEVLRNIAMQWRDVTGGPSGLSIPELHLGPWSFSGATTLYPLVAILVVAGVVVHLLVAASSLGRNMRAVRDDELAAAAMGTSVRTTQMAGFLIGAAYAAVAGIVYGVALTYLSPQILSVDLSVRMLAMVVVGGLGSVLGAVLGAVGLSLAPEMLRSLDRYWTLVYGSLIVVAVLAGKGGLVAVGRRVRDLVVSRLHGPRADDDDIDEELEAIDLEQLRVLRTAGAGLAVEGVSVDFRGLRAVDDVSIEFAPGAIHAVIGPNGAGKTTLLNTIGGQVVPQRGRIVLADRGDISRDGPHLRARAGIGRTFQQSRLFASQTVRENLRSAAESGGCRGAGAVELTEIIVRGLGLGALADLECSTLSHGHRRLVEIGRALALRPRVVLLDEPAAGLSSADCDRLATLLRWLADDAALTIILVEHNMEFVAQLADRITVMNHGAVLAAGRPDVVLNDRDVVTAYLGEEQFVDIA